MIKQSEAKLVSSKSVQQLNAEREEMIAREVAKIQVRVDTSIKFLGFLPAVKPAAGL